VGATSFRHSGAAADRAGPPWVGALAGGLVLASSFAGGPVLRAVAGVVHVATELMHLGRLIPPVG